MHPTQLRPACLRPACLRLALACGLALLIAACAPIQPQAGLSGGGMANPASVNCVDQGGTLSIVSRPDGGQYGICLFEDNLQCEEWALMRGDCPVGGVKVTGYTTEAAVFCAITGGTYAAADGEQGSCTLPGGGVCDAQAYYEGACGRDTVTYTDPFAYCTGTVNTDEPGPNYLGERAPEAVVAAMRTALGAPDLPDAMFAEGGFYWRCMDGQVYGCVVGANLPCMTKADLSQEPSAEMTAFCAENAQAEAIPAAVTGRATVYAWSCQAGAPVAGEQVFHADAAGFIEEIWYALPAP